jgi:hypothetical protein
MKIKVALILLVIVMVLVRFPKRKILTNSFQNGKYITVFRPFQLRWQNHYYIIPYKFSGIFITPSNYFSIEPKADQDMSVDWTPENYELAIQLPFCEDVQRVIYNIDTAKYHIAKYCGNNTKYIIPSEPSFYDNTRYSVFYLSEWLP